jgi:site-specific DNA-methyltransferase (adenine-specific)
VVFYKYTFLGDSFLMEIKRTRRHEVSFSEGGIVCSSAEEFLKTIADNSADIVFLDPPFNLKKLYSSKMPLLDKKPKDDYFKWLTGIIDESVRILSPGGAFYMYHLPEIAMQIGSYAQGKLDFRHWIAISMKNGFARGNRLYPSHYALLYFTRGKPVIFNRPKIEPQRCKSCGEYAKDYGGYKKIIDEKGINLSDIWDDLSPVRHAKDKNRDANELPKKLFERIIEISGKNEKLYVDPFGGSGTGAIAALEKGMKIAICDILPENYLLIKKRVKDYLKNQK